MSETMSEFVRVERRDKVALVTIDRPKVNALNRQVLDELRQTFANLDASSGLRAVVLTGAGSSHFVAGADIAEMVELSAVEARDFARAGHAAFSAIENHQLPVIAAVNGTALGGGCELMAACDLRVASEQARIGQPEVTLGIPPGFGGTQRLERLVGLGRAKELVLLGHPIDASEAHRIGLVNRVVAHDRVLDEALEWAQRFEKAAPLAVGLAKTALNYGPDVALDEGLEYESHLFGLAFSTHDQKEGMRAFAERREPEYRGE